MPTAEVGALRMTASSGRTIEWEIINFFNRPCGEFVMSSPPFLLSDSKYFLRLNPQYGTPSKVYLFLFKQCLSPQRHVAYTFGIKKANGSVFKIFSGNHLFSNNGSCTTEDHNFPRSELLDSRDAVAPDGVLKVFLYAQTIEEGAAPHSVDAVSQTLSSEGLEMLSQNFKELLISGSHGDVTFKVHNQELLAHKSVLSARSTVFRAMLETDMSEKDSGIVDIDDSDPAHFKDFLLYLYSGKLDVVSLNNSQALYFLADKYNLNELKIACSQCLAHEICVDSVFNVVQLASLHDEPELLETATEFFIKHASVLLTTSEWSAFFAENFTLANELLIKMANKYHKVM